jgi:cellulase/cellobiase CelA1
VDKFSGLDNVNIYLDAAHGGWLGWRSSMVGFVRYYSSVNLIFEYSKTDFLTKKIFNRRIFSLFEYSIRSSYFSKKQMISLPIS